MRCDQHPMHNDDRRTGYTSWPPVASKTVDGMDLGNAQRERPCMMHGDPGPTESAMMAVGRSAAFTLMELLVVISIVAILAGMLMPAISSVKTAAMAVGCLSNQRQIGLGLTAYAAEAEGLLPPSQVQASLFFWSDADKVGAYLESESTSGGAFFLGKRRGVLLCQGDLRLPQHAYPLNISYGLNKDVFPYANAGLAPWTKLSRLNALKRLPDCVFLTDTQDLRWNADPTWLAPALPNLTYVPLEAVVSWAGAPAKAPYEMMGRHRAGANVLFGDARASFSNDLPSQVAARKLFINQIHIP